VIAGEASLPFMPPTARTLSQAMPQARLRMLEGSDSQREPGHPRSGPGGLLHLVTSAGSAAHTTPGRARPLPATAARRWRAAAFSASSSA
jgi:hypothetical protein